MQEIELKFLIPNDKISAIRQRMSVKNAKTQALFAYYFDTENQDLAKHGIALRIRYENNQWVQTIKTAGDGISQRLEFNHILPIQSNPNQKAANLITPNISLIDDPNIQKIFKILLKEKQLKLQFFCEIERISRIVKQGLSKIEIAFDTGKIATGLPNQNSFSVTEIELELIDGQMSDLVAVAKTWCQKYQLYLSTITKAQRGNLLQLNQSFAKPQKASLSALKQNLSNNNAKHKINQIQFLQQVIQNCLLQILPNATAIASGSSDGEYVHQIRVGIRRLRTALKYFSQFTNDLDWQKKLKFHFNLLGKYRDKEVLKLKTQPMLEQQGAPHIAWTTDVAVMPMAVVRSADFQSLMLDLIAFSQQISDKNSTKVKPVLIKILDKLFDKIDKASQKFATLSVAKQHQIRKDLKALRYLCEFASPLFKQKSAKKFIDFLTPIQDILGDYHDNAVGHAHYTQKAKTDSQALFAVGWFGSQEQQSAKHCEKVLQTIHSAPKFWVDK